MQPGRSRYSEGVAWVRVNGSFSPSVIDARPGERLRLVLRREETAACSSHVVFPSLGKSVMLPPFEDVAIDLGPLPAGDHEFRCRLGVLRGSIRVHDDHGTPHPRKLRPGRHPTPDDIASRKSYAVSDTAEGGGAEMKRPTVNITAPERFARVFIGLVAIVGGVLLLASTGGAVSTVLEVLLMLAGLDLVLTGALGHCPLYRKLGYVPPSLRRPA